MFTLVISTYNRDNILLNHLSHWTTCINIYEIHVVFHNPNKIIPKQLTKLAKKYNIIIRQQESNKISNRFNVPDNGFKTDAVFSVDDDFVIDCDLVNTAYEYWSNTVDPSKEIVGFSPRSIDFRDHDSIIPYKWDDACKSCSYNIIFITKGAFIHSKYYSIYFNEKYNIQRNLVDKYITGEDILMSYVFHDFNKGYDYNLTAFQAVNFTHKIKNTYIRPFSSNFNLFEMVDVIKSTTNINSLSVRSSWKRKYIIESINNVTENIYFKSNKWAIVNDTSTNIVHIVEKNCLLWNLKCSSEKYIYPNKIGMIIHSLITWCIFVYIFIICIRKTRKSIKYTKLRDKCNCNKTKI
jgi:hypothetical protein